MTQILNTLNNPNKIDSLLASCEEPLFSPLEQPDLQAKKIVPITQGDKAQQAVVYIVDDNASVREGMGDLLKAHGHSVELFESSEKFLAARRSDRKGCLLVDALLPGMSGLDLLKQLREQGHQLPAIMITGKGDIALAVQAMKAGASDFIEKPIGS
ncbi:MAG TPA: histidine kinase, partial [Rhodospirillaceae bacterium]|nr:histidine kinase [Rhodospirillaceae bacterium]